VGGYEVTPVDTVAAGDVFNGCLAVAIAEGRNLIDAARFANAAAAIAVTRHGAQASAPRRDEIYKFQSTREGLSS
jgi:ribokinase